MVTIAVVDAQTKEELNSPVVKRMKDVIKRVLKVK
jgi:hypothetical protein